MSVDCLQSASKSRVEVPLTSVLDAVFRQNAMAPIADTPDNLYTARSMRAPRVKLVTRPVSVSTARVQVVEALPKVASDAMPFFTVRVA
jgi:hypothetical protein